MALADAKTRQGVVIGFLTAQAGWPSVSAKFELGHGLMNVRADSRVARKLAPGKSIELDTVYLASNENAFTALEKYGDAVAALANPRPRTGPTALWCSWYAHRMAMSEDLVLKNAEVAAKNFKPLGFEIMQLDHGWQKGDITGNWVPNERFPHGLKWLSEELKNKYGLKLGLWIAPTDVADTSDLYKQHPDWVLKGGDGKPLVNWRWYWKPNPNCYELDASLPAAKSWIEQTFARLHSEGASYFKIDFIASSAGEQFSPADPYTTHGWGVLNSAMHAIRAGAGADAWIRYCQPPPLLSVGLANSAYGGDDTYDAGVPETMRTLRDNARSLAAGYWINDRLYHREICDMSVRMQADVEEARLRLAIMALGGCSISFSDELQYLPPSRIRMMQQVLPPGAPAMRPIDLWDRSQPSVWHLHCSNAGRQWEIVGLFNFADREEERTVQFVDVGLPADADVAAMEFWESAFAGIHRQKLTMKLAPHTCRVLALSKVTNVPQVVGTDMQILQGMHDLQDVKWDDQKATLSGVGRRMPGLLGRVFIHVPAGFDPHFDFPLRETSAQLTHISGPIWAVELPFSSATAPWNIPFGRIPPAP